MIPAWYMKFIPGHHGTLDRMGGLPSHLPPVFPTNYANEAEPLVIYEAMRQGVHVIACDRGSIAEMLCNGAGLAFSSERIVESATAQIAKFDRDRPALLAAKRRSMLQARRVRCASKLALENLLASMQGTYEHVRVSL